MSDVVNLNRFRKKQARSEKEKRAEGNRAKFGRTKAEKARDEKERTALAQHLDGSRRDNED